MKRIYPKLVLIPLKKSHMVGLACILVGIEFSQFMPNFFSLVAELTIAEVNLAIVLFGFN